LTPQAGCEVISTAEKIWVEETNVEVEISWQKVGNVGEDRRYLEVDAGGIA
jgi:hypothetical protein